MLLGQRKFVKSRLEHKAKNEKNLRCQSKIYRTNHKYYNCDSLERKKSTYNSPISVLIFVNAKR